jgi:hypothetical protein
MWAKRVNQTNRTDKDSRNTMKNSMKMALVAAAGLAVATSAQAQYAGDLIVGFTAGSGNDLVFDLGTVASLHNGETFSALTALLGGYTLSTVQWGVVGNTLNSGGRTTDNQIFTTTAGKTFPPASASSSTYASAQTAVGAIWGTAVSGAGQHFTVAANAASGNSWFEQTVSPSTTTQYKNAYENPNVTGLTSDVLWSVDDQGGATAELGTFTLNSAGVFTFNTVAVPEPATYGVLAGLGLLALSIRRQVAFKA